MQRLASWAPLSVLALASCATGLAHPVGGPPLMARWPRRADLHGLSGLLPRVLMPSHLS